MTTIAILLEDKREGFLATALMLPDCQAWGTTRQEALQNVQSLVAARFEQGEIVSVEVHSKSENPWISFAGMFKDDPQWDQFMAAIAADRQELDAALEAEYRQDQADQDNAVA